MSAKKVKETIHEGIAYKHQRLWFAVEPIEPGDTIELTNPHIKKIRYIGRNIKSDTILIQPIQAAAAIMKSEFLVMTLTFLADHL